MIRDNIPVELAFREQWISKKDYNKGINCKDPDNRKRLDEIPEHQDAALITSGTDLMMIYADNALSVQGELYADVADIIQEINRAADTSTYTERAKYGRSLTMIYDLSDNAKDFQPMHKVLELPGHDRENVNGKPTRIEIFYKQDKAFFLTGDRLADSIGWILGGEAAAAAMEEVINICDLLEARTYDNYKNLKKSDKITRGEILASVRQLEDIERQEVSWLLPQLIPVRETTILASDGGSGKGFITAEILAGLTRGTMPTFLQSDIPFENPASTVLYLTTEDPANEILRPRMEDAGADMSKIRFIDRANEILQSISFSDENGILSVLLEELRPDLVVFDPFQAFVPERVRMSERNQIRQCLNHLTVLSGLYGTTFLILCHTNKRDTLEARKCLADSADIWDHARSVIFVGNTKELDVKYFTQEKTNYGRQAKESILYTIEDPGVVKFFQKSKKHFRDFELEKQKDIRRSGEPGAKEDAMQFIVQTLEASKNHTMLVSELTGHCAAMSISEGTMKRAKTELSKQGKIKVFQSGFGDGKEWKIRLKNYGKQVPEVDSENV